MWFLQLYIFYNGSFRLGQRGMEGLGDHDRLQYSRQGKSAGRDEVSAGLRNSSTKLGYEIIYEHARSSNEKTVASEGRIDWFGNLSLLLFD